MTCFKKMFLRFWGWICTNEKVKYFADAKCEIMLRIVKFVLTHK